MKRKKPTSARMPVFEIGDDVPRELALLTAAFATALGCCLAFTAFAAALFLVVGTGRSAVFGGSAAAETKGGGAEGEIDNGFHGVLFWLGLEFWPGTIRIGKC
jgi:hypothetical protein